MLHRYVREDDLHQTFLCGQREEPSWREETRAQYIDDWERYWNCMATEDRSRDALTSHDADLTLGGNRHHEGGREYSGISFVNGARSQNGSGPYTEGSLLGRGSPHTASVGSST